MSVGRGFVAVTPSDTNNIGKDGSGNFPDALRFGTGGNAVLVGLDGTIAIITNISDGETLPVAVRRVNSTGTTATDIVGIYI